jgi:predicted kinase
MRTKKLYIIRGLPGAGKSTEANKLGCLVIEPQDQYSIQNGKYKWRIEDVEEADWAALEIVKTAMVHELDVAIAEVLPKLKDIEPYLLLAEEYDYTVEVHDLKISIEKSRDRGSHNVPEEDTTQMFAEWEDWPTQDL